MLLVGVEPVHLPAECHARLPCSLRPRVMTVEVMTSNGWHLNRDSQDSQTARLSCFHMQHSLPFFLRRCTMQCSIDLTVSTHTTTIRPILAFTAVRRTGRGTSSKLLSCRAVRYLIWSNITTICQYLLIALKSHLFLKSSHIISYQTVSFLVHLSLGRASHCTALI